MTVEIKYLEKLKLHYLEVSTEVLTQLNDNNEKEKFNQRIIINVQEKIKWQAGIVALGDGKGYVTRSEARMKILNLQHWKYSLIYIREKHFRIRA